NMPPVTLNLLIINVLIWLLCSLAPSAGMSLDRLCGLHYFLSPDFKFWQPLTYMFMHANFSHLFFNMFGVIMFGSIIERVFGSARYLLFYLTVGVGAAFIQEAVYAVWIGNLASSLPDNISLDSIANGTLLLTQGMPQDTIMSLYRLINIPTVGASGALYGVLLAFAMTFPNMPLYIMFIPVPIKAKWMVLGYGILELFLGMTGLQQGVAHFAHLGGMIVALALILYWRKRGEINRGPLY
ncbi:MAG: rhomboid family intramembrane serine protease, partial [Muribaculaceae bacterium]|nr:rhomboid family intramembrane serine protease [Muribaculaceae bacterium]